MKLHQWRINYVSFECRLQGTCWYFLHLPAAGGHGGDCLLPHEHDDHLKYGICMSSQDPPIWTFAWFVRRKGHPQSPAMQSSCCHKGRLFRSNAKSLAKTMPSGIMCVRLLGVELVRVGTCRSLSFNARWKAAMHHPAVRKKTNEQTQRAVHINVIAAVLESSSLIRIHVLVWFMFRFSLYLHSASCVLYRISLLWNSRQISCSSFAHLDVICTKLLRGVISSVRFWSFSSTSPIGFRV